MSEKRPAALGFIFITLLIDVTGLGIIIPVLPSLIKELINGDLSQAAQYGGWLLFAYAGMQFLFAPVLGGLSDRFGRRPVLLASLFGFGLDYLLLAFAPNIWWLFVGRLLAGVTGASFTTASAYIADISTPEKRAQNFGIIGAAFGLGFIIGPVIGGLLGQYGSRVPFFAAAVLALLNWLYGYFVLPESLPADKRRPFNIRRANPLGSLKALQKYPKVLGLVGAFFFIYLAGHVNQSTWAYFTMLEFGWNEAWVGYSLGFVGLTVAIVQGGLIRIVVPKIGQWNAVFVGMFFYIFGFTLFAFASQGWMMFAIMVPFALGGFAGPSLQSLISAQVPSNEQGELQGALTSMTSVTSIIGPPLMTNLFAYFTGENPIVYFPGAAFLAAALITVVAVFLAIPSFNKRNS
jgi:MFS transporter, DHA1 family, tetracycline resistance protein